MLGYIGREALQGGVVRVDGDAFKTAGRLLS
jgi:hypothetical protein